MLSDVRAELKAQGRPAPPEAWQAAMDSALLELVLAGKAPEARERLRAALAPAGERS